MNELVCRYDYYISIYLTWRRFHALLDRKSGPNQYSHAKERNELNFYKGELHSHYEFGLTFGNYPHFAYHQIPMTNHRYPTPTAPVAPVTPLAESALSTFNLKVPSNPLGELPSIYDPEIEGYMSHVSGDPAWYDRLR
jgi:hypothetical protein